MQTSVPIDAKPHRIDTVLCGKWLSEKKDDSYSEYIVTRKNKTMYAIKAKEIHKDGYEVKYYYAYYSKVNGGIFLSVFSRDSTKHEFALVKLDLASSGNTLKISWVSDKNKPDVSSPEELREWIGQNMHKPDFFDVAEVSDIFHRVK